jgi:beta-glucanase (GH16 family)
VWSDEFHGSNGSEVDGSKWNYDVGGGERGWGNNELEYYTSGTENAAIQSDMLVITASSDGASKYRCFYGPCKFTSARLTTSHKFVQRYGRFEARIKIPRGHGMWPAFWMLGQDFPTPNDWPVCGEIDIMENIGNEPSIVHGTVHGPGPALYVDEGIGGTFALPGAASLADDFHVYAVEWEEAHIDFYFDEQLYKTIVPSDPPPGARWVWDHPFFMILNVALGGDWPDPPPDGTTMLPQTMMVDYVRVYAR